MLKSHIANRQKRTTLPCQTKMRVTLPANHHQIRIVQFPRSEPIPPATLEILAYCLLFVLDLFHDVFETVECIVDFDCGWEDELWLFEGGGGGLDGWGLWELWELLL